MNVAANLINGRFQSRDSRNCIENGYENPGKFSSAFKSVMGVTPAKYRKHSKKYQQIGHYFSRRFFNIVSGLILFNLAIAAAHFIERTFVM